MALPSIAIPEFVTILPSSGQSITFRPFLVKEEKILLMAAEAKDFASIGRAVMQIVQACVLTPNQDVAQWPFFDIEHLFIQIRAKSVGEKITLRYHHANDTNRAGTSCTEITTVVVNLDTIQTIAPRADAAVIVIDEQMSMRLRYPTLAAMIAMIVPLTEASTAFSSAAAFDLIAHCVESVTVGDRVHLVESTEDTIRFLEFLPVDAMKQIDVFFKTMPKASCSLTYTCTACGQTDTIQLSGLQDFF